MRSSFSNLVAVLLIPCLVADPSVRAGAALLSPETVQSPAPRAPFEEEALVESLSGFVQAIFPAAKVLWIQWFHQLPGRSAIHPVTAFWATTGSPPMHAKPGVYLPGRRQPVSRAAMTRLSKEAEAKTGQAADGTRLQLSTDLVLGDFQVVQVGWIKVLLPVSVAEFNPLLLEHLTRALRRAIDTEHLFPTRHQRPIPIILATEILQLNDGALQGHLAGTCLHDGVVFLDNNADHFMTGTHRQLASAILCATLILHEVRHEAEQSDGTNVEKAYFRKDRAALLALIAKTGRRPELLREMAAQAPTADLLQGVRIPAEPPKEDLILTPRTFKKKYPDLVRTLSMEWVESHWEDLQRLESSAGDRAGFLFTYGLPKLIEAYDAPWVQDPKRWPDLMRMGIASKREAGALFGLGLPALKKEFRLIGVNAWWAHWVKMAESGGENAWSIFSDGIPSLRRQMGPAWFTEHLEPLQGLVERDPDSASLVMRRTIPANREPILDLGLEAFIARLPRQRHSLRILTPIALGRLEGQLGIDWVYEHRWELDELLENRWGSGLGLQEDPLKIGRLVDVHGADWLKARWATLHALAIDAEGHAGALVDILAALPQPPDDAHLRTNGEAIVRFLRSGAASHVEMQLSMPRAIKHLYDKLGHDLTDEQMPVILEEAAAFGEDALDWLEGGLPALAHLVRADTIRPLSRAVRDGGRAAPDHLADVLRAYLPATAEIVTQDNLRSFVRSLVLVARVASAPKSANVPSMLGSLTAHLTAENIFPVGKALARLGLTKDHQGHRALATAREAVGEAWIVRHIQELSILEPETLANMLSETLPSVKEHPDDVLPQIEAAVKVCSQMKVSQAVAFPMVLSLLTLMGNEWVTENAEDLGALFHARERKAAYPELITYVTKEVFTADLGRLVSALGKQWVQANGKRLLAAARSIDDFDLSQMSRWAAFDPAFLRALLAEQQIGRSPLNSATEVDRVLRTLRLAVGAETPEEELRLLVRDGAPAIVRAAHNHVPYYRDTLQALKSAVPSMSATTRERIEAFESVGDSQDRKRVDAIIDILTKSRGLIPTNAIARVVRDVASWQDESEEDAKLLPSIQALLCGLQRDDFSPPRWASIQENILKLRQSTTDHNRVRTFELLFSSAHMSWMADKSVDLAHHLAFYTEIMALYPRLGFQMLDGLLTGLHEKSVDAALPAEEQRQALDFMDTIHTFSPELFPLFRHEGRPALEQLFQFSQKILRDEVGPQEIKLLLEGFRGQAADPYDILAATIQIVIPASGASFVKRKEISGLLRKFVEAGDRRAHIPELLRGKNFGAGEESAITLTGWSLRPGQSFDPEGRIAALMDELRFRDKDLSDSDLAARRTIDREALRDALDAYFKDRTTAQRDKVLAAYYRLVSHDDRLGEKIDRISAGSYHGLNLLEQLFIDKENLFEQLRKEVDPYLAEHPAARPETVVELEGEIRNPRSLAAQIIGLWTKSGQDQTAVKERFARWLMGIGLQTLKMALLPLVPEPLHAFLIDLVVKASPTRPMTTAEIISEILEPAVAVVDQEKKKFISTDTDRKVILDFHVVKGIPYGLWGLNAGVCIATDLALWRKPEFMLLSIVDRETNTVAGFVHLFTVEQDGKKILAIPGIEPSVEFLSTLKARDIYPLIEQAIIRVADTGGYDSVLLPDNAGILSNRSGITEQAVKRKYPKVTLKIPIRWNTLPTPYPFSTGYELWRRPSVKADVPQAPETEMLALDSTYLARAVLKTGGFGKFLTFVFSPEKERRQIAIELGVNPHQLQLSLSPEEHDRVPTRMAPWYESFSQYGVDFEEKHHSTAVQRGIRRNGIRGIYAWSAAGGLLLGFGTSLLWGQPIWPFVSSFLWGLIGMMSSWAVQSRYSGGVDQNEVLRVGLLGGALATAAHLVLGFLDAGSFLPLVQLVITFSAGVFAGDLRHLVHNLSHRDVPLATTENPLFSGRGNGNGSKILSVAKRGEIEAAYGLVPRDHTITRYIDEALAEIFPKAAPEDRPSVRVLGSFGYDLNAFAFLDGTIVLTPEMLEFVESKEELIFVLLHEFMHIDRAHFDQVETARQQDRRRAVLGLNRYGEYDADTAAILMMADLGINVQGAIHFFEKMERRAAASKKLKEKTSKKRSPLDELENLNWDPAHGFDMDRLLTAHSLTILADMAALSHDLTPLPDAFRTAVEALPKGNRIELLLSKATPASDRNALAGGADWWLLQNTLSQTRSKNHAAFRVLLKRFDGLVAQTFPDWHGTDETVGKALLLHAVLGIPLLDPQFDPPPPLAALRDNALAALADPDALERLNRLLAADPVSPTGLVLKAQSLASFLTHALRHRSMEGLYEGDAGNRFTWETYVPQAARLVESSIKVLNERATDRAPAEIIWTALVFLGLEQLGVYGQLRHKATIDAALAQVRQQSPATLSPDRLTMLIRNDPSMDVELKPILLADLRRAKFLPALQGGLHGGPEQIFRAKLLRAVTSLVSPSEYSHFSVLCDNHSVGMLMQVIPAIIDDARRLGWSERQLSMLCAATQNYAERELAARARTSEDLANALRLVQITTQDPADYVLNITRLFDRAAEIMSSQARVGTVYLPSWDDLGQMRRMAEDPGTLAEKGYTPLVPLPKASLADCQGFRFLQQLAFVERVQGIGDAATFYDELDRYISEWRLVSLNDLRYSGDSLLADRLDASMDRLVAKGLSFLDLKDKGPVTENRLLLISFFVQDTLLRKYLQEDILRKQVDLMTFEEAFDHIFKRFKLNPPVGSAKIAEHLIEEKATEDTHFEMLRGQIGALLRMDSMEKAAWAGNLVVAEGILSLTFKNQETLLHHLLQTEAGDRPFKEHYFAIWYKRLKTWMGLKSGWYKLWKDSAHSTTTSTDDDLRRLTRTAFVKWDEGGPPYVMQDKPGRNLEFYYPIDHAIQLFYRLESAGRYFLLRHLLLAPDSGVLRDPKKRERLLQALMDHALDEGEDSGAAAILREVMQAFIRVASPEDLYFAFNPILMGRIANPPAHPTAWNDIAAPSVEEAYQHVFRTTSGKQDFLEKFKPEIIAGINNRMQAWIHGAPQRVDAHVRAEDRLWSVLPEDLFVRNARKLSPAQMAVEIGKQLWTIGIRGLQLLSQFVHLPENYRRAFQTILNDVKGQSRLTMYFTLKRETPDLVKRIRRYGRRRGGGSLFTTYDVDVAEAGGAVKLKILKVLNPNAQYHKDRIVKIVKDAILTLKPEYQRLATLIDVIDEWAEGDILDPNFAVQDREFRVHDGFRPAEWEGRGANYRIRIPHSDETGSVRIRLEEFVQGKDLAELGDLPLEKRQEIVSLLVRSYDRQIRGVNPLAPSLVHSDIHPGNIRITPEGEVALLDRNFYIKLDVQDKFALAALLGQKDNPQGMASAFVAYLLGQPGNAERAASLGAAERDALSRRVAAAAEGKARSGAFEDMALEMFIQLHEEGLKVPLKMTLLLKNIISLSQMAHDVELTLEEARTFVPGNPSRTPPAPAGHSHNLPGQDRSAGAA